MFLLEYAHITFFYRIRDICVRPQKRLRPIDPQSLPTTNRFVILVALGHYLHSNCAINRHKWFSILLFPLECICCVERGSESDDCNHSWMDQVEANKKVSSRSSFPDGEFNFFLVDWREREINESREWEKFGETVRLDLVDGVSNDDRNVFLGDFWTKKSGDNC